MRSKFHHNGAHQTENSAEILTFSPLLCTPKCPFSVIFIYILHFPKFYLCLQPTFNRRTSGHCLRSFRAANVSDSPSPPYNTCSAPHRTSSPVLASLSLARHNCTRFNATKVGHNAALQTQNLTKVKIHTQCSTSSISCFVRLSISHHITFITFQSSTLLPAYL